MTVRPIILLLTYSRNEWLIPSIRPTLGILWPDHPRVITVSDSPQPADIDLAYPGRNFCQLLHDCVEELIADEREAPDHVYLLLEDLCPLRPLDPVFLAAIERIAHDMKLDAIHFDHHPFNVQRVSANMVPSKRL